MSELVNGKIPANTVCPWNDTCRLAEEGTCHHKGVNHHIEFSCALARGFDLCHFTPDRFRNHLLKTA